MTSPSQAVACTDVHAHAVPQALLDMLVQGEARFPHVAVRAARKDLPSGGSASSSAIIHPARRAWPDQRGPPPRVDGRQRGDLPGHRRMA